MLNNKQMSIGNIMGRRDPGKHVEAIRLEETIDYVLEGTSPKTTLLAFNMLIKHIWHGHYDLIQTAARSQLDRLKPVVEHLLEGAGWEVHIVDSLKRTEAADYIHLACYELQVHEVPFSATTNIELRLDELCNKCGDMRKKEETLALLKGRIGLYAYNLREVDEEDWDYILAIMEQEGRDLENLHNVEGQDLTTGARSFRWFRDDEEAKDEAREYLTDDPELWQMAVADERTTEGLEEWAEGVLDTGGWAEALGSYDGLERVAQLKDGTWFPYVRTN